VVRRSRLLVTLATPILVLPLLVAASPPPQTNESRILRFNTFTMDAATLAARAQGFLAAEGLDVETTITPNSTVQMRGLGDGTWDLVNTGFDNVLAWSGREGAEIVAVAQADAGVSLPVYVRPEIRDWEDLRGRGHPNRGGVHRGYVRRWARYSRIASSLRRPLRASPSAAQPSAQQRGQRAALPHTERGQQRAIDERAPDATAGHQSPRG
jgi:ABC-type nitrate/sulfonate/bicarbonate transport system substrate-binding protein